MKNITAFVVCSFVHFSFVSIAITNVLSSSLSQTDKDKLATAVLVVSISPLWIVSGLKYLDRFLDEL